MSVLQDKAVSAVREAANEWAARLAAPDLSHADKVEFATWLRASPIHVREYLGAEALRSSVKAAVEADTTDVRTALLDAPSNVIELAQRPGPAVDLSVISRPALRWRSLAVAVALVLVVGISVGLTLSGAFSHDRYVTAIGETRRIPLLDGSSVELNTGSKIRIEFSADYRDVYLDKGEAFFVVAKDASRPFRVWSGSAMVRAVGTQFSVYRKADETVVTVVEGIVAAEKDRDSVQLTAGEQVVIASRAASAPLPVQAVRIDAARETSWRQHRLIFDNEPLSNVVAEFNRYNRRRLVIEDAQLAAQQISGVFDPDKPDGLLLFLERTDGVRATEQFGNTVVLSR